jgi:hypothetical protein
MMRSTQAINSAIAATQKGAFSWIRPPQNTLEPAAQGQFGNLIFGFAITEALGIFSLLIALLLLFGL